MKFGMVNKLTTVNRFILHILQRNITRLAVITRKTNIKLGILKGGGNWKRAVLLYFYPKGVRQIFLSKTNKKINFGKHLFKNLLFFRRIKIEIGNDFWLAELSVLKKTIGGKVKECNWKAISK